MSALVSLAPFARAWQPVARPGERCDGCGTPLDGEHHRHLVDLDRSALRCVCDACRPLASEDRYRLVPTRILIDPDFILDEARWSALDIPVRLAFIYFSSRLGRWAAFYPSPAGAAESLLTMESFSGLAAATRLVSAAAPDVEALLVHGDRESRFETFLVPIDLCYQLVGKVRLHWRGFSGGDRAWQELETFFADLRGRAEVVA
jgi:hypothetical protein